MSAKGDVAEYYVKENLQDLKDGKINKKGLARKMMESHPGLYKDLEQARHFVRIYTGTAGVRGMNPERVSEFVSDQKRGLKALPISLSKPIKDFILPDYKKIGIISDIHIPYHDIEATLIAINFLKKIQIDALYLNGDGIDFYQISRFVRDPGMVDVATEISMLRAFIEYLKQELKVPIYYKFGNHEERYETYLKTNAKELMGLDAFTLESLLDLDVTYIKSRQKTKMGKLNVLHGHEFGRSIFNPVNPARGTFLKTKANTLIGHYHQKSEHDESNINGDAIGCYSTGCLCTLSPEYSPFAYTKWNHGLAVVHMDGEQFSVDNRRILNGKVL